MRLSGMAKTWLIDLDGTVVRHGGDRDHNDVLLPGVREFWAQIPDQDKIVVLTARMPRHEPQSRAFLASQGLRVDHFIFGLPTGERILINDRKPSGLLTAFAINVGRDEGLHGIAIEVDPAL